MKKTKQIGEEKPNNSDWQERFDEKYKRFCLRETYGFEKEQYENLKDFITKTLQQQREEIIKEIQSDILDFLQEANDEDGIPPMVSEYFNSFYQFLENK